MVNTKIRWVILFAAKDGEALYSQQKQDRKQTVAQISSVQFSHSGMSDSLQPHEPQHAKPPGPSPTPRVYPNSCPSSQWCHPTISSFVVPFSSRLQSCPASGSFPMSQFFTSGGQRIGVSASESIFPMNTQDWFPLEWTGWTSLLSKGLSSLQFYSAVLQHYSSKASILRCSAFFIVKLSHPYMTTGMAIAFSKQTFVGKVMSLLFNMLSRLVITFLPRSKCLLISWLQSPSAMILEHKKNSLSLFPLFPHLFPMKWWDQMLWS